MDNGLSRDAYWRDLPRPPQMDGTYIEWLEAMAQHYMILAAYEWDSLRCNEVDEYIATREAVLPQRDMLLSVTQRLGRDRGSYHEKLGRSDA